jgi:hypothetical protein
MDCLLAVSRHQAGVIVDVLHSLPEAVLPSRRFLHAPPRMEHFARCSDHREVVTPSGRLIVNAAYLQTGIVRVQKRTHSAMPNKQHISSLIP